MQSIKFDAFDRRPASSYDSCVENKGPMNKLFPNRREICCSVKAVSDAVALSIRVGITAWDNAASLWVLQTQAIGSFDGADIADPINQVSLRC